jgi:2-dehydro-3-deoxyglucarate aldolase
VTQTLQAKLRTGDPVFGSWLQFGHTGTAEIMASAGFDWLSIDLEHTTIDLDTAFRMIQVIQLAGCTPFVRLSSNDPVQAKRVLDAGAQGVIVPSVQSADDARRAVASVKYPPLGSRGVGIGRAHGYGARVPEYLQDANDRTIVIAMIEQCEGVERAEDILAVDGIDGVFIGPYDLSASCGVAGQLSHPLVGEAVTRVLAAARKLGKAAGIHVVHPPVTQVADRLAQGFRFIAYGGDMLFLTPAAGQAAADLRTV